MNLHVVKRGLVAELRDKISSNLDRYLEGNFDDILLPEYVIAVKDTKLNLDEITKLTPQSGGSYDAQNSQIVYSALSGITRYLARDERL